MQAAYCSFNAGFKEVEVTFDTAALRSGTQAAFTIRALVRNALVFFLLALLTVYFARLFPKMQKGTDFAAFYAAAQMVRQGHGRHLYDIAMQDQYLARYSGRTGIYFIHPPFETLIYLPFSLGSLAQAYLLWSIFNMILLVFVSRALAPYVFTKQPWQVLPPLLLLFAPLLLNSLHGQDSLLLLFSLVLAFTSWGNRREFATGCFLACGLFKPHLALAAAIPILATGRKKIFAGFVSVAIALLLLSVEISGWSFLASYPEFLLHFSELPLAGVHLQQMANLHALCALTVAGSPRVAVLLTALSSLLVLVLAARPSAQTGTSSRLGGLLFANAVAGAILVSYHLSPQDLTILLLPMALVVDHLRRTSDVSTFSKTLFLASLALIFLPPLHLFLLDIYVYTYMCLPVVVLFATTYAEIMRLSARRA